MARVLLRFRAVETVVDLDLAAVTERAERLNRWQAEVFDTRLSDAPYVSVVVTIDDVDDEAVEELRATFLDLQGMTPHVLRAIGDEVPLERADTALLETAGHSFPA
ncbi:MAG: hypothetical protein ACRDUV_01805 [Pseudonocardiaceae bacterium]